MSPNAVRVYAHTRGLFKLWARILVQVTVYRRFQIGRGPLDQSKAYDMS